jgi:hypothetical protein
MIQIGAKYIHIDRGYIYIYISRQTYIYIYLYLDRQTDITYIHCIHTYITYTHYMHTYITYINRHIPTYIHNTHTCINMHMYVHPHMHVIIWLIHGQPHIQKYTTCLSATGFPSSKPKPKLTTCNQIDTLRGEGGGGSKSWKNQFGI